MRSSSLFLVFAGLLPSEDALAKGGILVLEIEGPGLPSAVLQACDRALRIEAKASTKVEILKKPALDFSGMKLAAGCTGGDECLQIIGRTLGAATVIHAVMGGTIEEASLDLVMVEVRSGKRRSIHRDLTALAEDNLGPFKGAVAELFGVKRSPERGQISIFLAGSSGNLDGAELLLDDKRVSLADLSTVEPGNHRLELRQGGFEPFIWLGKVQEGGKTKVGVELKAIAPVAVAPPSVPKETAETATPELGAAGSEDDPGEAAPAAGLETSPEAAPRIFTWVLGGTAAAAAVLGLVFGLRESSLESGVTDEQTRYNQECTNARTAAAQAMWCRSVCDAESSGDCSDADQAATIATVSWVLSGALIAATVAAFVLEMPEEPAWEAGVAPTADGAAASFAYHF